jgi:sulfonate transport system substrate-binding protein
MVKLVTGLTKQPAGQYDSWLFTKRDYYRNPDDRPDLAALQRNLDALDDIGLLAGKVDVAAHADLSLVTEAAARVNSGN